MTERNPREGIREELRQKIMEQLQECSRMEDESFTNRLTVRSGKKGRNYFCLLKSDCGSGAAFMTVFGVWTSYRSC